MTLDHESEDTMTMHLPSRRVLIGGAAVAALSTIAVVVVVLDWQTIIGWLVLLGALRLRYGRRGRRRLIEWAGLAAGGIAGWRGLHAEGRRREELHAARLETESARAQELRSRVEHRQRRRGEQEKAEKAAYWRGAADAGSTGGQ